MYELDIINISTSSIENIDAHGCYNITVEVCRTSKAIYHPAVGAILSSS